VRRTIGNVVFIALIAFVFWPWALAIVEGVRWFLHLAPLLAWDEDRIGFAAVWPLGACFVAFFFLWLISGVLEWF
jgi:hypothetical protein